MEVVWTDGGNDRPPGAALQLSADDTTLTWDAANDWRIPVAGIPADLWPVLPAVGGLALDDGGTIRPLPAQPPA